MTATFFRSDEFMVKAIVGVTLGFTRRKNGVGHDIHGKQSQPSSTQEAR